jgi:hypothetical protein
MPGLLPNALRREAGDLSFVVFLVAVVLCLVRARDLPSWAVALGSTSVSVTPADPALVALALVSILRLRRRRRASRALLGAAGVFAAILGVSSLANDAEAIVAAGKLLELGALTLGAAALLDSANRLRILVATVVLVATLATAWAVVEFLGAGGGRQASFVGEHDLSLLATMSLAVGLAGLFLGRDGWFTPLALVVGLVGTVLGSSLASLLGVFLAAGAITAIALRRREFRWRAGIVTLAVVCAASAGTLAMRQGDLGFLQSWFGPPAERPGQYSASWSQRLIYTYVGLRVFADNPVLGTGWEGELPPSDFAEYVPDARARYPDEPPHYFPPSDRDFVPQQTYDQVLYELGLVGAAAFLALGVAAIRRTVTAARTAVGEAAYLPAAWLGCVAAALAGAALFGGSPIAALFWLTLGVAAAVPRPVAA